MTNSEAGKIGGRPTGTHKPMNHYVKAIHHGKEIERLAKHWLKKCGGSRKEALTLLRHPYEFEDNCEDIKVLQTVLEITK
jgi:hypothetical protein